jgi:ATPase subunit of ABC transporter with duplicated ATPase domains
MALLIASDMHKDMAGQPLLRGVSFKLERRERMTIAGRNGAGKTTLLRMLAGETSIDRGELSVAKGVRIALHDQRPPRERGMPLRDYLLSGCAEELAIEAELAALEAKMAGGDADEATLTRYAGAQARWRPAAATCGATARPRWRTGSGFRDADLDRPLDTFSGGQLTRASLARALATGADVLLLDEPTNHLDIESLEWLEQTLVDLDAAVVLVAHDRWFLEAVGTAVLELEARPLALLLRHLAPVAPRTGRARDGAGHGDRQAAGGDRADGALHRALPLQGQQGQTGAVAGQETRRRSSASSAIRRTEGPGVLVRRARALGPGDLRAARRARRDRRSRRSCCSITRSCGWNAASTSRWSAPTAPARPP